MIAGRAAVFVDRLIIRADTLRESTRDLCSVWGTFRVPGKFQASGTGRVPWQRMSIGVKDRSLGIRTVPLAAVLS
jgi:hypothetical protein